MKTYENLTGRNKERATAEAQRIGYPPDLLLYDEHGFVPDYIEQSVENAERKVAKKIAKRL